MSCSIWRLFFRFAAAIFFVTRMSSGTFRNGPSLRRRCCPYAFKERQKVGVDLVRVGGGHAMWKARINLQRCVLQYLRGHETRSADWHNLIVLPMHHQRG